MFSPSTVVATTLNVAVTVPPWFPRWQVVGTTSFAAPQLAGFVPARAENTVSAAA
jgi:hypothetical protein